MSSVTLVVAASAGAVVALAVALGVVVVSGVADDDAAGLRLAGSVGASGPLHPVIASAVRVMGRVMRVASFMGFLWVRVTGAWCSVLLFRMSIVLHNRAASAKGVACVSVPE